MSFDELQWQDLIKPLRVQRLLNDFSSLTGITLVIMDTQGNPVTTQTEPHNRLCMDFIKKNPLGNSNCIDCDKYWTSVAAKDFAHKIYTCKNGLVDFVTPIIFENEVSAYLFGGQIRLKDIKEHNKINNNKKISLKQIRIYDNLIDKGELVCLPDTWYEFHAKRLNIDPLVFFQALSEIPVLPKNKIEASARMLSGLAETISSLISKNLKTIKIIGSNDQILTEIANLIQSQDSAKRILDDLKNIVPYCKASLQIIENNTRTLLDSRGFELYNIDNQFLSPVSNDKLINRVINGREPIILSNTTIDPDWKSQAGTRDVLSWIGAPIIYNEKVFALITLDHNTLGFYTEKYKNTLVSFLNKIAPTFWHTIILNDAGNIINYMKIVNDVVKSISSETDIEGLLEKIVYEVKNKLHCTHCTIFLSEKINNEELLVAKAAEGGSKRTMDRTFSPGEGLAGMVYITGKTIITPNAHDNHYFSKARESKDRPRSMLVAPIKVGKRTIGVMSADQDEYDWFKQRDKHLMDALGQHIGIAIQRSNTTKILKNIGNNILTLNNVDDILQTLVTSAIELINVSTGVIYFINKDKRTLINKFHPPGFKHPRPRLKKKSGLTRTIIDSGEPLSIPNTKKDDRVVPILKKEFYSILGVPIKINTDVIGVFFLDDKESHDFTKTEISLLSTLADQAAIALQNIELRKNLNSDLETHRSLEDVLVNLVIEEQNQEVTLQRIGKSIIKLLGKKVSPTINLYDENKDKFSEVHVYGSLAKSNILNRAPRPKIGTGSYVVKHKKPLYLGDVRKPPTGCPTIRNESILLGIKSFAAIPLKRKNYIVGVLFINSLKKLEFNEQIRRTLEIFASQAGLAIEISQLHQSVQISNALIKASNLDFIASGITHEFRHFLQSFYGNIAIIKTQSNEPEIIKEAWELENKIETALNVIENFYQIRARENNVVPFDINLLIQQIIDSSNYRLTEKKIKFTYFKSENNIIVLMNPAELQTVIINLLNNSIDAVAKHHKEKQIELKVKIIENYLLITLKDSGGGIRSEIKQYIYSPYYTTKTTGLGMGLFWVKEIIEKNHGEIDYVNNDIDGTTFNIKLPFNRKLSHGKQSN